MKTKIKYKDIVVIGLGTFGYELAVQLASKGHNVLAIDKNMEKVNHIKNFVSEAVQADITDIDVLKRLEIQKFDEIIFGMSSALESIILSITLMKKLQVQHIIGKANTLIQKEVLLKIGADEVILPEIATARRLADRISNPNIIEKFEIDSGQYLIEVIVPKKFHNKNLKELELRKKHGINILMKKNKDKMEIISDPSTKLSTGDIILVVGEEKIVNNIFNS